jgi:hypothetical protein
MHDASRFLLSKRLEKENERIESMMQDLTDYVQENSRARFRKNFISQ